MRDRNEGVCWTKVRYQGKSNRARTGLKLDDLFTFSTVFTGHFLDVSYMLGIKLMIKRVMVLVLLAQ